MKYTYQFADETVAIEVGEEWVTILEDEDRREFNNDHAQTRRHCSLESYNLDEGLLPSDTNLERDAVIAEEQSELSRRLHSAIEKLTPEQQELAAEVLLGGMREKDFAAEHGISPAAVTQRKSTVMKKIKKFF